MKLSNQAVGALMLALQNSLMEQSDVVPVLKNFDLVKSPDTTRWGSKTGEVDVRNPPIIRVGNKFTLEDN